MPLEQDILEYARAGLRESTSTYGAIDDETRQEIEKARNYDRMLRKYYDQKFVKPIVVGLRNQSLPAARNLVREVKSQRDREWILMRVAQMSKLMQAAQQDEYSKRGFLGRFGDNLVKIGGTLSNASFEMAEAGSGLYEMATGTGFDDADVEYMKHLEVARNAHNPYIPKERGPFLSTAANVTRAGFHMLPSAKLASMYGRGGMAAYWGALLAPEEKKKFQATGMDPLSAGLAGALSAGAQGAVESLVVIPGLSGAKGAPSGLAGRSVKETLQKIGQAAGHFGVEAAKEAGVEEYAQAAISEGGQFVAEQFTGQGDRQFLDIFGEAGKQATEALPIAAALTGAGVGGKVITEVQMEKQMKAMEAEMKRIEKVYEDVLDHERRGAVPSRNTWFKKWKFGEEGKSKMSRKASVQQLATDIRTFKMAEALESDNIPTREQWNKLNLPAKFSATEDMRREFIQKSLLDGQHEMDQAVQNQGAEQAPDVSVRTTPATNAVDMEEVERTTGLSEFLEDTAGRVGVSSEVFRRATGYSKRMMKRFLAARGELPISIFEAKLKRDGKLSKIQKQVAFDAAEYSRAFKKQIPKGTHANDASVVELAMLADRVLHNDAKLSELPKDLRKPVRKMRNSIDALSRRLMSSGAVQGDLAQTIANNLGVYVTRSYRAFDDPHWYRKVPEDTKNAAAAYLRKEYPDKTEQQIQGLIEHILYAGKAAQNPIALIQRYQLGDKDLGVLFKRKEIDPAIRALLGEYHDPLVNYAKTMTNVGSLVANHEFLEQVKTEGAGKFFSHPDVGPVQNEYGELKVPIAVKGDSSMHPLNGWYTTPEIKEAFERATTPQNLPHWLRAYMTVNSAVKVSKTVLSPMTHVRNTVGNIGFAVAQGHWRVGKMGKSLVGVTHDLFNMKKEVWQDYIKRASELNLVSQDVHSGELRDNLKDAFSRGVEEFAYNPERARKAKTMAAAKGTLKAATKLYQAEDDVWKLYAWENEKARYRKALPEMTEQQIEELTARIVIDTYPSYSMVPEGVKALRHFPIIGTFVSFPAEVIRTTYHTLRIASEELADPRLRKIGAQRVAGTMVMATGTAALASAFRQWFRVSREEDEDLRRVALPPWQENNQLLHLGRQDDGNYRLIDMSYVDPWSYIRTPLIAFMRGESWEDKLKDAFSEAAMPFASHEILYEKFIEVQQNDVDGVNVYNPEDDTDQQIKDMVRHVWDALEPGGVTSLKRIVKGFTGEQTTSGRTYKPVSEIIAVASGQRLQDIDVKQSLYWKGVDFNSRKRATEKILSRVMYRRGHVSPQEIADAYERSERHREMLFRGMSQVVDSAQRLQVGYGETIRILKRSGITLRDLNTLFEGYMPKQFTQRHFKYMYDANPEEYESRLGALLMAREEKINQGLDSQQDLD